MPLRELPGVPDDNTVEPETTPAEGHHVTEDLVPMNAGSIEETKERKP
jgi:hypothetical protein